MTFPVSGVDNFYGFGAKNMIGSASVVCPLDAEQLVLVAAT